jgi:hypothetical protein
MEFSRNFSQTIERTCWQIDETAAHEKRVVKSSDRYKKVDRFIGNVKATQEFPKEPMESTESKLTPV